jgi:glyoxylase-like metal-dependent hydrolase (beta-lactamase superfamily II)
MFDVVTVETPKLGDRSYLVHDGTRALVVDPQRDVDRILTLAAERGVSVCAVFETHIHNDYVTGGYALARATGAAYHVNADDRVAVDRVGLRDGDVVAVGDRLSVEAVLTPGHTFTHLSYLLRHDDAVVAAFTGGSLLFGAVGRPDLLGPESTEPLARLQFRSARRLAGMAPGGAQVLPTHGFGSFCSAGTAEVDASTIAAERGRNPALTQDEDEFVAALLAGLDAYPAYYAHMGPRNTDPPGEPPDLAPPARADAAELRRRIAAGEWVVDLRTRAVYAAGHVPGSLNFGLDGSMPTYLGWTIPWGTPLTLLADTAADVAAAQLELVRIGIDRVEAAGVGVRGAATLPRATFAELEPARAARDLVVLDVRRDLEWADGHVAGAVHVPLHELRSRLDEVPDGQVWVHCASGYRAAVAASMLAAAGRDTVLVDDDWDRAAAAGVRLATVSGSPLEPR